MKKLLLIALIGAVSAVSLEAKKRGCVVCGRAMAPAVTFQAAPVVPVVAAAVQTAKSLVVKESEKTLADLKTELEECNKTLKTTQDAVRKEALRVVIAKLKQRIAQLEAQTTC